MIPSNGNVLLKHLP